MQKLDFYDRGPDRPWINERLTTAAIVGHTTSNTARLWVRVWEPGDYVAFLSATRISNEAVIVPKNANADQTFEFKLPDGTSQAIPQPSQAAIINYDTDLTTVF